MFKISLLAIMFSISTLSFAAEPTKPASAKPELKTPTEDVTIELTNKLVDGKKVWLPADVSAKLGKVKFKLVNTLAEPHGFHIKGVISSPVVVQANETKVVDATLPKAGVYPIVCHMHPAHVGAKLTVK